MYRKTGYFPTVVGSRPEMLNVELHVDEPLPCPVYVAVKLVVWADADAERASPPMTEHTTRRERSRMPPPSRLVRPIRTHGWRRALPRRESARSPSGR